MTIVLKSPVYKVLQTKKKTQAQLFRNINDGDLIQFSVPIEKAGTGCHGTKAMYITITNLTTGETAGYSFNQLPSKLEYFKWEEVK